MANTVAIAMGVAFTVVSILGFVAPAAGGLHLSPAHTLLNLVVAILALFFGLIATEKGARGFCLTFGGLFAALGLVGFLAGSSQATSLVGMEPLMDNVLWKIIPGQVEFGSRDHILHLIMGGILLAGGFATDRRDTKDKGVESTREERDLRRMPTRPPLQRLPH